MSKKCKTMEGSLRESEAAIGVSSSIFESPEPQLFSLARSRKSKDGNIESVISLQKVAGRERVKISRRVMTKSREIGGRPCGRKKDWRNVRNIRRWYYKKRVKPGKRRQILEGRRKPERRVMKPGAKNSGRAGEPRSSENGNLRKTEKCEGAVQEKCCG